MSPPRNTLFDQAADKIGFHDAPFPTVDCLAQPRIEDSVAAGQAREPFRL